MLSLSQDTQILMQGCVIKLISQSVLFEMTKHTFKLITIRGIPLASVRDVDNNLPVCAWSSRGQTVASLTGLISSLLSLRRYRKYA